MTAKLRSDVKGLLISALLALAAGAANADTIHLRAWLNGDQVPLAVPGTGLGVVTFDSVSKIMTWSVSYQNLSGPCTAAQFHGPAPAQVDANPAVDMTCSASPLNGSAPLDATQEVQLLSGQWYIDIHTDAHVNGEIRGQVVRVRGDFNGDGRSDVSWRNWNTGQNYLYPMNGTTILPGEGYLRTVADLNWKMVAFGDFNGDGKTDIFWRNASTGENYVYLMNGTSIIGEGYVRTVADQNWQVAGAGDFNGDGKADVLWRNKFTGENYVYLMNGTAIAGEGYVRTVADQNWQPVGVGDFNGDGRADVLWRNKASGQNYIYLMNSTTIAGEGYLRTVANQNWRVAGVADFDGDGRADILWRNASTGENYIYPMASLAIRSTEGYLRTVADLSWQMVALGDFNADGRTDILWRNGTTGNNYIYFMGGTSIIAEGYSRTVADQKWSVAGAMPVIAGQISGLDFPSNADSQSNDSSVRFRFTDSALVPIYGIGGAGVTYLWKYRPRQQTGYYTAFFWGNDDGAGTDSTFTWNSSGTYPADSYYGMHPYPHDGTGPLYFTGTEHRWEISIEGYDVVDADHPVVKGVWYSQAARVWGASGAAKNEEFYWNLPDTTTDIVQRMTPPDYGNMMPPSPALTWGDAPWDPSLERASGVLRGWQIYNALLTIEQVTTLAACETDACVRSTAQSLGVLSSLWYLNMNPQDESDISDKSGAGHHPTWWNGNRPTRWTP